MKPAFENTTDTKTKIIAAATDLFAKKGIENVFVRELTAVAGVNQAAINYHFGSKDALCEAVLDSVARNVNARRLAKLHQVLKKHEALNQLPDVGAILETFMEPYLGPDDAGEGAVLTQLLLKDRIRRDEMTTRLIRKHFDPLAREYIAALTLACPQVDPSDMYWRYAMMYGAVILISTDRIKDNRLSTMSNGLVDASDSIELRRTLMDFLIPAITAPDQKKPEPRKVSPRSHTVKRIR